MVRLLGWAMVGLILALPVTLVGVGAAKLVAVHQSSQHRQATGLVESTDIERVRDDGIGVGERATYTYRPVVRYRFQVDGGSRLGTRVTLLGESSSEAWAASVVARYPRGATVTVHYDPRDSDVAYLEAGGGAFLAWVLIVLGGGPLLAWVISAIRQRRSPSPPTPLEPSSH